jgi:hypothetical protein
MILPDGDRTVVPIRPDDPAAGQLVEVRGVVWCAYNGVSYDAVCAFGPPSTRRIVERPPGVPRADATYSDIPSVTGGAPRPDGRLSWQPAAPTLVEADIHAHRYVFRFPSLARGVSPTVRFDIDRFVDELLIPPSEVRRSLSGGFEMRVQAAPPPSPWPAALAAVPVLALTGGLAWVIQRRMANVALDYDLQSQVNRIRERAAAARRALRPEDARIVPVRAHLCALEAGAARTAGQAQQVRSARSLHSRAALERDVRALQQRASAGAPTPDVVLQTLAEKQRALESLAELERTEVKLASRLDRIEATVEGALAGLHSVRAGTMESGARESVCRSLASEVAALRAATVTPRPHG